MATAVAHPSNPVKSSIGLPGRRYDHIFFPGMALLILATVFVGFARTYYLAGMFHAPTFGASMTSRSFLSLTALSSSLPAWPRNTDSTC